MPTLGELRVLTADMPDETEVGMMGCDCWLGWCGHIITSPAHPPWSIYPSVRLGSDYQCDECREAGNG